MHIAILADIHGNMPALEAVLADLESFQPDKIIVAGDICGGPNSAEAIQKLHDIGCQMIRGNKEDYALLFDSGQAPDWWHTSRCWGFNRWDYQHLDKAALALIRALPGELVLSWPGKDSIRVVHGSPRSSSEHLYPKYTKDALNTALELTIEPVLVCGHTHIAWQETRNGCLVFNPGAVSNPMGFIGAQYAMLDWHGDGWELEFHQVGYDTTLVRKIFEESGLLEAGSGFSRACLKEIETGESTALEFVQYTFKLAREAGLGDCEYVPNDIWDRAVITFDW